MARKTLVSPVGRLSFPHFFRPNSFQDGKPKFSCILIFDEGEDLSELKEAATAAAKEKFKERLGTLKLRTPFRDGEEKEHIDGFEPGQTFISFSAESRPSVIDIERCLLDESDMGTKIYSGCYARVSCNVYAYDKNGNRGVAFGLNNVQIIRDGEPLTGAARTDPMEDFADDIEAEEASYAIPDESGDSDSDLW